MKKPLVSVIILSYNTKKLLADCLRSVFKSELNNCRMEVIVVDNGSTDGSVNEIRKKKYGIRNLEIIENGENIGFAAGNNRARKVVRGGYVLFLNPDTLVEKNTIDESIRFLDENKKVGAMTCKILLPDGSLDKDARRSFPTPWVAVSHLSHLDRIFKRSRLFSRYWYGYMDEDEIHEVDVLQGAYFLVRMRVLEKVGWFDEDYFMDGEDVDLSWKIKNAGWEIVYYPRVKITHVKGAAKGKNKGVKKLSLKSRIPVVLAGVNSMETFYRKRLWKMYPAFVNVCVITAIKVLKGIRIIRLLL